MKNPQKIPKKLLKIDGLSGLACVLGCLRPLSRAPTPLPPLAFPLPNLLRPLAFRVLSAYVVRDFFLTITPRPPERTCQPTEGSQNIKNHFCA